MNLKNFVRYFFTFFLIVFCSYIFGQDRVIIKNINPNLHPDGSALNFNSSKLFYRYDSSPGCLSKNFDSGYVDTFSIGKNKFRIKAADSNYCVVEKFDGTKWRKNFSFELSPYGYDKTKDVNADGYDDFINNFEWSGDVYFFDPEQKKFLDKSGLSIAQDWKLLDTAKKIFCAFSEGNLTKPAISQLYTFKNFKIVYLYSLEIIFNQDNNYTIEKEILYKGDKTNIVSEISPAQEISVNDFDYKKFWRRRYKKLLGYH